MKKLLIVCMAVFLLFGTGCSKKDEVKITAGSIIAEKYAPENSMAVLRFSSIDKLFTSLDIKPESVMGEPTAEDRTEMIKFLGFDPLNLAEYEKIGLDTKKEFAWVLSDLIVDAAEVEKTQANIGFLVPVKDKSNAFNFIKERINANKTDDFTVSEENGMIIVKSTEYQYVSVTIKADSEYMVFDFAMNSKESADLFFTSAKHLADSPNYKEVKNSMNLNSDIGFYMDFKSIMAKNEKSLQDITYNPLFAQNELKSIDFLKYYRGFGVSTDLSKTDLKVEAVSFIDSANPINKIIQNVKLDKSVILGIEKKPAMLIALMANAGEYLEFYLKSAPDNVKVEFEKSIAKIDSSWGIDFKKEIVDQLAGSINLGIFDGTSINLTQYNTVLNFNVKRPAEFIQLLEKTKQMSGIMPVEKNQYEELFQLKPGDDIAVYSVYMGMMPGYILIDKDRVSAVTTKDYISYIAAKKNPSFIEKMEDKEIADKLKNDQNYFYLDVAETYIATKTIYQFFAGMSGQESILDAKIDAFVNNFNYVYAGGNYAGEKASGEFIIKTKFKKPFFSALQEEITKLDLNK